MALSQTLACHWEHEGCSSVTNKREVKVTPTCTQHCTVCLVSSGGKHSSALNGHTSPPFFIWPSIKRCTARRWPSRWCLCTNLRPHNEHTKGLSPVWVRSCFRRLLVLLYVLLQTEQVLLLIVAFGGSSCCAGPWGEAACEKQCCYG